jgi:hypothetical protein
MAMECQMTSRCFLVQIGFWWLLAYFVLQAVLVHHGRKLKRLTLVLLTALSRVSDAAPHPSYHRRRYSCLATFFETQDLNTSPFGIFSKHIHRKYNYGFSFL